MKITDKEINAAALAHAKETLGDAQFKTNKDAAKSIAMDFAQGVRWATKTLKQKEG
jgi:hypothetical protein